MSRRLPFILAVFALLLFGVLAATGWWVLQPLNPQQSTSQRFVVPKGQSVRRIGERLAEAKLIRHPLAFRFVAWQGKLESLIQAGSFQLTPSMSVGQIARELTKGTSDVWVTIPEGWRSEEIAESFARQDLAAFDPNEFRRLVAENNDEGQLFPDTYLVPRETTAAQVRQLLRATFTQKVEKGLAKDLEKAERDGRKLQDVLTMASLVQREARSEEDMRMVAGILWNRVDDGTALNVDASLQYLNGYNAQLKTWWAPILASDKNKNTTSSYNTYTRPGLPIGAICNPGLDAIKAALNPVDTDNYYYLHDNDGVMHFAKTLEQHNANVVKYLR